MKVMKCGHQFHVKCADVCHLCENDLETTENNEEANRISPQLMFDFSIFDYGAKDSENFAENFCDKNQEFMEANELFDFEIDSLSDFYLSDCD